MPEPEPIANNMAKRDAEAEAFCWRPGQPCAKAKRGENAVIDAALNI